MNTFLKLGKPLIKDKMGFVRETHWCDNNIKKEEFKYNSDLSVHKTIEEAEKKHKETVEFLKTLSNEEYFKKVNIGFRIYETHLSEKQFLINNYLSNL
jgi:hypothetical protein